VSLCCKQACLAGCAASSLTGALCADDHTHAERLILWDTEAGTEILALVGHADAVYASEYLDEQRIVGGSYDR